MKNITNELMNEHQQILKVIDIVLDECNNLEAGNPLNKVFFSKVVGFIKNFADGFHHVKEEDILFKAMLENVDCMHCNPIPVMLHEHDAGRQFVKGMVAALETENSTTLIENARGYCFLLQNHIYKEDNVLYPMAEEALNDAQKQVVVEKYHQVRLDEFMDTDIEHFIQSLK